MVDDLARHAATRTTSRCTTGCGAAAFCRRRYQGVKFRAGGDPVLYLSNPAGVDAATRRRMLDDLAELNAMQLEEIGDPEIATRIAQYEMAFRMQTRVPELMDLSNEPEHVFDLYGPDVRKPGTSRPTACWRGGWRSAACASSSCSIAAGTSTRNLPKQIAGQCRTPTSLRRHCWRT